MFVYQRVICFALLYLYISGIKLARGNREKPHIHRIVLMMIEFN